MVTSNADALRERLDLTGAWNAKLDPLNEGERVGYAKPPYIAWRQVNVPASFDDVAGEPDRYEGVGWFRRTFGVPAAWQGKRVILRALGVNNQCRIWVNGRLAGENPDAHLGFELPVGEFLRFGAENLIVLRIANDRRGDTIPGAGVGWHPYGGILRELELEAMSPLHLGEIEIVAAPAAAGGEFTFRIQVRNGSGEPQQGTLRISVLDPQGAECTVRSKPFKLTPDQVDWVELKGTVANARPWLPDDPCLYTALVNLTVGDRNVDARCERFGFRRIEVGDESLLLNGRPIFLTGFNRHEDSNARDMCADHALTRADLEAMKTLGCNFVRLCHYPQHPQTLSLCDELGLLAMCEIPLYWWHGHAGGVGNCAQVLAAARRQLASLIRRDRNHPSVIFWSVSNETSTQYPEVVSGNEELLRLAKSLDSTRPSVHVSYPFWNADHGHRDRFVEDDVICVNSYPDPATGAAYWAEELEWLHRAYPGKPILVTEFGGHHEQQLPSLQAAFAGAQAAYVCGLTIWCWADHRWPVELTPYSPYGVYTRERKPRPPSVEAARRGFKVAQDRFHARQAATGKQLR